MTIVIDAMRLGEALNAAQHRQAVVAAQATRDMADTEAQRLGRMVIEGGGKVPTDTPERMRESTSACVSGSITQGGDGV